MEIGKNTYENAKKAAMQDICKHAEKYWKYLDRFERTGDTWNVFMAMYHEDCLKRIARDWNAKVSFPKGCTTVYWNVKD